MKEKWMLYTKRAEFNLIAKKFNISPILARVIRNRDVVGDKAIDEYLNGTIDSISSPWAYKDMDKACDIVKIKIACKSKIRIISDYDVDGICSGYILFKALQNLEADVDIVVPHRISDGYGINEKLIKDAYDNKVDTIITCDNGIAAKEQIKYAKSLGITIIVTDHHEVPFTDESGKREYILPPADAIIDHKQADCDYPFKDLCGAMVAYQFMRALYEVMGKDEKDLYPLLAYGGIATVCDVVPLIGENRIIVKEALSIIHKTKDIGLNALFKVCKIPKESIGSYHIGFIIGPCLNASGRLDTAKKAVDLLNETDEKNALSQAEKLKELNDGRKDMTEQGAKNAIQTAKDNRDKILVIYLPDCHESVAGIIAGRVREYYNKPTFIFTDAEDCIKGSARSIDEYDMFEELSKVKDLFIKFGGHKMAAGMSLEKDNLEELRKRLNENCRLTDEDMLKKVWIDTELPFKYVTMNLVKELSKLEPFGVANSKPTFACKNLQIVKMMVIGKTGNVIRLDLEDGDKIRMTAIMFNKSKEFLSFLNNKFGQNEIDKALNGEKNNINIMTIYYPNINEYNGNVTLQIIIESYA